MKTEIADIGSGIDVSAAFTATIADIKTSELGIKDNKFLEVRCGTLFGTLHMDKFLCPGIHCKCIEHEGTLITPRHFTVQAQKDKQKDWKGSIRIGRYNLRTLMEMKVIDFYEHDLRCSLKCHSRNYIKNSRKMLSDSLHGLEHATKMFQNGEPTTSDLGFHDDDIGLDGSFMDRKPSQLLLDFVTKSMNNNLHNEENEMEKALNEMKTESPNSSVLHQSSSSIITDSSTSSEASVTSSSMIGASLSTHNTNNNNHHNNNNLTNNGPQINGFLSALLEQQKQLQMAQTMSNNQNPLLSNFAANNNQQRPPNTINFDHIKKVMESSPTEFWLQMKRLGIIEDLLNILSMTVENVKRIYLNGTSFADEYAAIRLSKLASSLDLGEMFGQRIHARYIQTTLENNLLGNHEFIDLQRKMASMSNGPIQSPLNNHTFLQEHHHGLKRKGDNLFVDKLLPAQCSGIFSTSGGSLPALRFFDNIKRARLDK
uniref:SAND domain-containing protein n=1 Tax=Rhabditophanes sp. KR3021 TaxID=114890 RepID=A0AC35TWG1_9BILA